MPSYIVHASILTINIKVLNAPSNAAQSHELDKRLDAIATADRVLEGLPRSKYARHDSERSEYPTSCFPGTRELILESVKQWILSNDHTSARFYWLKGIAGVGEDSETFLLVLSAAAMSQ